VKINPNLSSKTYINSLLDKIPVKPEAERIRYRGMTILVTMPCWNEEGKAGVGVQAVPRDLVDVVCVVDNGSIDRTADEAKVAGALVISHPNNPGAGGGIRTGLQYGRRNGYDLLAVLAGLDDQVPSRQVLEHNLIGSINLPEYCQQM